MIETVRVRDVMSTDPRTIASDANVRNAAFAMARYAIGSLLVVESGRPVGILTERDLVVKVLARDGDADKLLAADVMSTPLLTVPPSLDVLEAARVMARHRVRRLPVSEAGSLVGIVTERDLLAVSPTLAEITTIEPGETEANGYTLAPCASCASLTDGGHALDGEAVCDACYRELRAR